MSIDPPNPYASPGNFALKASSSSAKQTKGIKFDGNYNLPKAEKLIVFIRRSNPNLSTNGGIHSQYGPLITHAKGSVSRDHAEISIDPPNKKFTISDRQSTYGSQVNLKDENGKGIKNIYVFDPGDTRDREARVSNYETGFFQERLPSNKDFFVDSVELDFSQPFSISLGSDGDLINLAYDHIVNDGNEIVHIQTSAGEKGGPSKISKKLLLAHNTLSTEAQEKGASVKTRSTFGSILARIWWTKD